MAVEDYITTIQVSYLEESARLARERRRERGALVAKLLGSVDPDPADVHRVALALDLDPAAPLLVAAVPAAADHELRRLGDQLVASARHVHLQEQSRHTLLFTRWHADASTSAETVLQHVTCGVGPLARGLARLPRSARIAAEIADSVPADRSGPHDLTQAWQWLAGAHLGELADELSEPVRQAMAHARAGEWERLRATVEAYARCGSMQQVGAQLFCHRNTVVNRLRRFADLTGYDVTVPVQATLAWSALSWLEAGLVSPPEV